MLAKQKLLDVSVSSADIREGVQVDTEKKFENLKTITVSVVVNWLRNCKFMPEIRRKNGWGFGAPFPAFPILCPSLYPLVAIAVSTQANLIQ